MRRTATLIALVVATALSAADGLPFSLIPRLPAAPALDGALTDPLWQQAAIVPAFVLLDGSGSPTQRTRLRLCHDGERLLIGAICAEDRLDRVRSATVSRDGAVWGDDCLEVFIGGPEPGAYYHLMLNPAGTVADEKCTGQEKDMGWDCDLEVRTGRREGAWTATVSVPLRQVGLEPGQPGRLNVCRSEIPHRELSCWSATLAGFHQPSRSGNVVLGTTSAALTALDWGQPWPGDNTAGYATQPAEALRLALTVAAGGRTRKAETESAGPGKLAYRFTEVGSVRLGFEASAGGALLSRQFLSLAVRDYRPELADFAQRLASLPARARIHPKRRLASLTLDEQRACYRSVNDVMREAIRAAGRSSETDLYRHPGGFVPRVCRETLGQPCPECGAAIAKLSFEGGACYICPGCQRQ